MPEDHQSESDIASKGVPYTTPTVREYKRVGLWEFDERLNARASELMSEAMEQCGTRDITTLLEYRAQSRNI